MEADVAHYFPGNPVRGIHWSGLTTEGAVMPGPLLFSLFFQIDRMRAAERLGLYEGGKLAQAYGENAIEKMKIEKMINALQSTASASNVSE